VAVLARDILGHSPMASAVARAYNSAPSGVRGQILWSEGQGAMPPEAEALLAFGRSMEAANLAIF